MNPLLQKPKTAIDLSSPLRTFGASKLPPVQVKPPVQTVAQKLSSPLTSITANAHKAAAIDVKKPTSLTSPLRTTGVSKLPNVPTTARPEGDGIVKSIVKGVAMPFLRTGANLAKMSHVTDSNYDATAPVRLPAYLGGKYFGDIKPIGQEGSFAHKVADTVGVSAEIASDFIGGGEAATAVKGSTKILKEAAIPILKKALGRGIQTGLVSGGLQSFGQALQEGKGAYDTAKQTLFGADAGGALGGILEPAIALPGLAVRQAKNIVDSGVNLQSGHIFGGEDTIKIPVKHLKDPVEPIPLSDRGDVIPNSVKAQMADFIDARQGTHMDLNKAMELEDAAPRIAQDYKIVPKKGESLEDAFQRRLHEEVGNDLKPTYSKNKETGRFTGSLKKSAAQNTTKSAYGAAAGFQQDENGNITYNPKKAALGMGAMYALTSGRMGEEGDNIASKLFSEGKSMLEEKRISLENFKNMLDMHPAKGLSKYANANGELPEVLGGVKGKFGNSGDSIVTQHGFGDTETARNSYQDYLKGKKQYEEVKQEYNDLKDQWRRVLISNVRVDGSKLPGFSEGAVAPRVQNVIETLKRDIPRGQLATPKDVSIAREAVYSAPKLARDTPEMRSLDAMAQTAKTFTYSEPVTDMAKEIVNVPNTPPQKKIGFLDFFRTPDRVLNKIGLGREAGQLRASHEAYLKELPVHIDRITAWSKEVPEDANARIFAYLDGHPVPLNPNETRVATQIQGYLKDWATRLGLPQDKQISHYITHIFDFDSPREFPDEIAKLIQDKIPGSVYDPFLLQRLGARGYKQDTWGALEAYVKRGTRKVNMDPVLSHIAEKAEFLEASQHKYVKNYLDRVNMRPTELDSLLDNTIKQAVGYKYGGRPTTYLTQKARKMVFRGTLGGNISSALRNLSQGANTYAKLGEQHTLSGYIKMATSMNHDELYKSGVLDDGFITDRGLSVAQKFWDKVDKGLFAAFNMAEKINRGAAYYGGKSKALSQGATEEQAIEYAKKIVRDTQFTFGTIDTPAVLSSDIAKTLGQFQSYTLKQTEFLAEMAKNKEYLGLARYAGAGLGFVFTIGKLFGMSPKDLIPTFKFGLPPSVQIPIDTYKAITTKEDKYGNPLTTQDRVNATLKAGAPLVPGGSQLKKTIPGIKAVAEGGTFTKGGTQRYEIPQTAGNYARGALFGVNNLPSANEYYDNKDAAAEEKIANKEKIQPIYDQAKALLAQGKEDEADNLVSTLTDDDYKTYKAIKTADHKKMNAVGKQKVKPIVEQAHQLILAGQQDEADALIQELSDEDYEYYKLEKRALGYN